MLRQPAGLVVYAVAMQAALAILHRGACSNKQNGPGMSKQQGTVQCSAGKSRPGRMGKAAQTAAVTPKSMLNSACPVAALLLCRSRVACAEELACLIEREGPRVYSGDHLHTCCCQAAAN